jgi:biofilm PGA synthesis lipoprotein PgaB
MNPPSIPRRLHWLAGLACLCAAGAAHADQLPAADPDDGQSFRVLAFHDVREDVRASFEQNPDDTAIDSKQLLETFTWLQHEDYHPVSLDQIIAARQGGPPLPSRPVLLTFDDGYASDYSLVFPLLKRFHYPAVMALVTSWLDVPVDGSVDLGSHSVPRSDFVSWKQVVEMSHSGLVEIASHTDRLHRGIPGNPQGNSLPAAVTLEYDARTGQYESEAAYRQRVETDLRRSRTIIESHTGRRVRALAWPYGAWNDAAVEAARTAGMGITFSLDDGANNASVPLSALRRELATYDLDTTDYLKLLRLPPSGELLATNRAIQVDLDYVYDPDPVQQEANLSVLLDRILAIGPSSVFLQGYADPDGTGTAQALYFPNRVLPMRADLFSRVAWQLRTRARVQVYAWCRSAPSSRPPARRWRITWCKALRCRLRR